MCQTHPLASDFCISAAHSIAAHGSESVLHDDRLDATCVFVFVDGFAFVDGCRSVPIYTISISNQSPPSSQTLSKAQSRCGHTTVGARRCNLGAGSRAKRTLVAMAGFCLWEKTEQREVSGALLRKGCWKAQTLPIFFKLQQHQALMVRSCLQSIDARAPPDGKGFVRPR